MEVGARLCAEHQPQQVLIWKRFELFRQAMGVGERCGWSFGHSRLEFGHFEAADIAVRTLIPIHFVAHFVLHFVARRLESRHHRADPA